MKTTQLVFLLLFFCLGIHQAQGKDKIGTMIANAYAQKDYSSVLMLSEYDMITEQDMRFWIMSHREVFYCPDTILKIKTTTAWYFGATRTIVTEVWFVKAENGARRKAHFDEIKRKKEEERLALLKKQQDAIKKQEDADRLEKERLARIKSQIEKGIFTGKHYYTYKEGKYVGDFVKGKREGYGTQNLANGEWYEGNFKNDAANGQGTYRQSSGIRYSGNFVNNKRHGKFTAIRWTLLGLVSDSWQLEYEHDVLVSKNQTSSGMTDFLNDLSSGGSMSSNSSSSTIEEKKVIQEEDCEAKYIREYEQLNKSKIQYGEWELDNSLVVHDYKRHIKFSDGTTGNIYQGSNTQRYFLSLGGTTNIFYKSYEGVIRALFIYKKCGEAPMIERM